MIAGNNECIIIDGGRYMRQGSIFRVFNEIIQKRYGIDLSFGDDGKKEITLDECHNILSEICDNLYENMYKDIANSFHAYD